MRLDWLKLGVWTLMIGGCLFIWYLVIRAWAVVF